MADQDETSEERLQWLRDHGVTVETPQDRVEARAAAAAARHLKPGDPGTRTFTYVKIPAGMSDPLVEMTGVVLDDKSKPEDAMLPLLASEFESGKVDGESLKQAAMHNLTAGTSQLGLDAITPESIAAAGGQAEPFKLSNSVTMYLDAVGALKRLPLNPRAADLAERAGYGGGVAFHGDIYIGRRDQDTLRNIDFNLSETQPSANWIKSAFGENMARQAAENGSGGMTAEEISTRGGDGDGYKWTQDPSDIEITIPTPSGTKGKSVNITFRTTQISVKIAGGMDTVLELFGKVSPDGCSWSLSDGNVVATLEKAEEGETWPALIRS